MNAITITNTNSISNDLRTNKHWMNYFNIDEALEGFDAHISKLISDTTPEQYTRKTYYRGLAYFFKWCMNITEPDLPDDIDNWQNILMLVKFDGIPLPTSGVVDRFIAHLLKEKEWYHGKTLKNGVSAKTVANRYLAPLRLFLKQLKTQYIPVHGHERDYVIDCKEQFERAISVDNPPKPVEEESPMWNSKFVRLTPEQVNDALSAIDRATLSGSRDYALLRLMFESALRVSEVQRVTLNKIKPHKDYYLVRVRGKRKKTAPVAISAECFWAIQTWVQMYNEPLADDDPRRITDDMPVFQALRKGDNHFGIDEIYDEERDKSAKGKLRPELGIYRKTIGDIVHRRTGAALGKNLACRAHDCRRTYAYIMWLKRVDIFEIKKALRHESIETTYRYIGEEPNRDNTLLAKVMTIA